VRGLVCARDSSCYSHLREMTKEGNKIDSEDKDTRLVNAWRTCLPHISLLQKESEVSHSDCINLLWLVQFEALIFVQNTEI